MKLNRGEVIGIINMVFVKESKESVLSKPSGISFAIPVRFLRELLQKAASSDAIGGAFRLRATFGDCQAVRGPGGLAGFW
jgi:S1-C subfamily serine protease